MVADKAEKDIIEMEAVVLQVMTNGVCKVRLENGKEITAYLSGKFKNGKIKVYPQDKVKVEFSIYSTEKGRISFKYRTDNYNRSPFAKKSTSARRIRDRRH